MKPKKEDMREKQKNTPLKECFAIEGYSMNV